MNVASIVAKSLVIPFTHRFRHAAAERSATETLWVEATGQHALCGFGEGCPRRYVTGEDLGTATRFVAKWRDAWMASVRDGESLARWVTGHRPDIDRNPAAWTAVEIALLDLLGKTEGRTLESLLGLPALSGRWRYTAVLGDAPLVQFEARLARCVAAGFRDFKVKLSGDVWRDRAKLGALAAYGIPPQAVRADANGLWRDADAAIGALRALDYRFAAVEEPLHAGDFTGMRRIGSAIGARVILDESLLRLGQLGEIAADAGRWIVNLRVSKMGGLLRSLELVSALRGIGCRVIVGAHVGETSLLTRAGMSIAAAARDLVVALEGAYGTHLLAADVARPSVMLGGGGIVDSRTLPVGAPGLGLRIDRSLPYALPLASGQAALR